MLRNFYHQEGTADQQARQKRWADFAHKAEDLEHGTMQLLQALRWKPEKRWKRVAIGSVRPEDREWSARVVCVSWRLGVGEEERRRDVVGLNIHQISRATMYDAGQSVILTRHRRRRVTEYGGLAGQRNVGVAVPLEVLGLLIAIPFLPA